MKNNETKKDSIAIVAIKALKDIAINANKKEGNMALAVNIIAIVMITVIAVSTTLFLFSIDFTELLK